MPQPRANAKDLQKLVKGSTRAHHARVAACLDWLALHKIPAVPISTTGVPVPDGRGGYRLHTNPRQVGISDIMACLPHSIRIMVVAPKHGVPGYSEMRDIGQLVLIEVKTGNATRTAAQREQQKRFADAGALCLVVREVTELRALLLPHHPATRWVGVGFDR